MDFSEQFNFLDDEKLSAIPENVTPSMVQRRQFPINVENGRAVVNIDTASQEIFDTDFRICYNLTISINGMYTDSQPLVNALDNKYRRMFNDPKRFRYQPKQYPLNNVLSKTTIRIDSNSMEFPNKDIVTPLSFYDKNGIHARGIGSVTEHAYMANINDTLDMDARDRRIPCRSVISEIKQSVNNTWLQKMVNEYSVSEPLFHPTLRKPFEKHGEGQTILSHTQNIQLEFNFVENWENLLFEFVSAGQLSYQFLDKLTTVQTLWDLKQLWKDSNGGLIDPDIEIGVTNLRVETKSYVLPIDIPPVIKNIYPIYKTQSFTIPQSEINNKHRTFESDVITLSYTPNRMYIFIKHVFDESVDPWSYTNSSFQRISSLELSDENSQLTTSFGDSALLFDMSKNNGYVHPFATFGDTIGSVISIDFRNGDVGGYKPNSSQTMRFKLKIEHTSPFIFNGNTYYRDAQNSTRTEREIPYTTFANAANRNSLVTDTIEWIPSYGELVVLTENEGVMTSVVGPSSVEYTFPK